MRDSDQPDRMGKRDRKTRTANVVRRSGVAERKDDTMTDDLPAVGTLAPLIEGAIGCIVIRPDGRRYVAHAVPDPLAQQKPD